MRGCAPGVWGLGGHGTWEMQEAGGWRQGPWGMDMEIGNTKCARITARRASPGPRGPGARGARMIALRASPPGLGELPVSALASRGREDNRDA